MARLPTWIRTELSTGPSFQRVRGLMDTLDLHTVCRSARCPNRHDCWSRGTATLMILGDVCTRRCGFCAVTGGQPAAVDPGEPARVAEGARRMALKHVVITSVTRDDLPDGGARAFAATIEAIRAELPAATVEVLTPDFRGSLAALRVVLEAGPDVFGHNLETVRRLQSAVRPQASYETSLDVLRFASTWQPSVAVKSGLMLGLGESAEEVVGAITDLRSAGCRMLTLGQYLAPTRAHRPTVRFAEPAEFDRLAAIARDMGFAGVSAAPLVRSSFEAERMLASTRGE
jgi:lipoyl synthase